MTEHLGDCPSEDLLAAYLDQVLPEWELRPLEEHLATCDMCAERAGELNRCRGVWDVLADPHQSVFSPLESEGVVQATLTGLFKELSGRVWSVAKLIYELPSRIPRLISMESFTESPFGQFEVGPIAQPVRTLGKRSPKERMSRARRVARASGRLGRQEIEIIFDEKTGETIALLTNWTSGPPPRLVITLVLADRKEEVQTVSVGWVKVRPAHFRALLSPSLEAGSEITIALGPPESED